MPVETDAKKLKVEATRRRNRGIVDLGRGGIRNQHIDFVGIDGEWRDEAGYEQVDVDMGEICLQIG